eukprot:CAMPEP_0183407374 /NCGR_PEP_ID=MMETSP0370-20130417/17316_1 /TAXON_ID=268820 /ORGANISM="Peridinium aciculiferum, Strain PAER-2" /LENGTH=368 /DNA_ID=CAMNT_0025589737 /DNA_START=105 /DNA_END=1211 /DNA_ORIENTATION=-
MAIHAAKSGKTSEAHHHISTALWLLEQYDAPAGELNKLRVWAHERTSTVGGGSTDTPKKVDGGPKKVDGGEADQEEQEKKVDSGEGHPNCTSRGSSRSRSRSICSSPTASVKESAWRPHERHVSLEEVIAWTTKRFEAVMSNEEEGAQAAGTIEAGKFAWFPGHLILLDMPPEILPMVARGCGVVNTDALCNFMSQNVSETWAYYLEVAVINRNPAMIRAIFLNWKTKGFEEGDFHEAIEDQRCGSFIYHLLESVPKVNRNSSPDCPPELIECIEVIMHLSLEVEVWGRMFLTGADPRTGGTTLHHAVRVGTKKWIETCVKAGVNPSRIDFNGNSAADLTIDSKVLKFLDITVRAKREADDAAEGESD